MDKLQEELVRRGTKTPPTDFRVHVDFWGHTKTRKMIRVLGEGAAICLQRLWAYAATHYFDGLLRRMDPDDIEEVAGWSGERGAWFTYCAANRWLDSTPEGVVIHNWQERQPWVLTAPTRSLRGSWDVHKKEHVYAGKAPQRPCVFCDGSIEPLEDLGKQGTLWETQRVPIESPNAPSPNPVTSTPSLVLEPENKKTSTRAYARARADAEETRIEGVTAAKYMQLADGVSKFTKRHRGLLAPGDEDWDAKFQADFGFAWSRWLLIQDGFDGQLQQRDRPAARRIRAPDPEKSRPLM